MDIATLLEYLQSVRLSMQQSADISNPNCLLCQPINSRVFWSLHKSSSFAASFSSHEDVLPVGSMEKVL